MRLKMGNIETTSSTNFQTTAFDIGNKAVIMEILRGKMYSNPIKIICQEIMCNARDAHREVGKSKVPIQLKFPTRLDPSFVIRDFGPGIDPKRMAEIFVMYGESTKRNSNAQTGGFGFGSKTPFSYSDTFSVITITPDKEGNLINREYVAYIDDSRLGAMSLVNESPATEPRGTSIIITSKEQDYNTFKEYAIQTAKHWDVKPIDASNDPIDWPDLEIILKGNGWAIGKCGQCAIVDGIEYRIDIANIIKNRNSFEDGVDTDNSFPAACKTLDFKLYFKTGEVDVTATREDLDYKGKTCRRIIKALRQMSVELSDQIRQEIQRAKSLREAVVSYEISKRRFGGFTDENVYWNGILIEPIRGRGLALKMIPDGSEKTDNDDNLNKKSDFIRLHAEFYRTYDYRARNGYGNVNTVRMEERTIEYIPVCESILICEDDVKHKLIKRRAKTILYDTPENKKLAAICIITFDNPEQRQLLCDKFHWNSLDIVKMSDIRPADIDKPKRSSHAKVSKIKKIGHNNGALSWIPATEADIDEDKVNYYVVMKKNMANIEDDNHGYDFDYKLNVTICHKINEKIKIFGVFSRYEEGLGPKWIRVTRSILEVVFTAIENSENMKFYFEYGNSFRFSYVRVKDVESLDKDSLFRKYIELFSEKRNRNIDINLEMKTYIQWCEFMGKKPKFSGDLESRVLTEYPLLTELSMAHRMKQDILLYIKAKDDAKKAALSSAISNQGEKQ